MTQRLDQVTLFSQVFHCVDVSLVRGAKKITWRSKCRCGKAYVFNCRDYEFPFVSPEEITRRRIVKLICKDCLDSEEQAAKVLLDTIREKAGATLKEILDRIDSLEANDLLDGDAKTILVNVKDPHARINSVVSALQRTPEVVQDDQGNSHDLTSRWRVADLS